MKELFLEIGNKLAKLIDVKSIISLALIFTLVLLVLTEKNIDENVFLLFSNIITAVVTHFFTKKSKEVKDEDNR